jgi:DivIVA domain-containing protein
MSDTTPDDVSRAEFRTVFRGFDPEEVRAFLRTVTNQVTELTAERDRLREQMTAAGGKALKQEFEQIGREVASVLEQARQAAEAMRERAAAEAARWRSEAMADSDAELRQARADAEQLRGDAWSTAEELLAQSQREAAHLVDEAKAEALRLQGEAERESHRLTSAARRQAEEAVRLARMEAERLTIDAQARHDEIIETATRQSETAQERTRALEQRRDELKKELETVRGALASMEAAMDERREQLGMSTTASSAPPKAERQPEAPAGHWVPGETVRVVRPEPPAGSAEPTGTTTQRIAEGPEIRLISAEELKGWKAPEERDEGKPAEEPGEIEPTAEPAAPTHGADVEATEVTEEPEAPGDEEVVGGGEQAPADEAGPVETSSPAEKPQARQQSFDDLVGLFERLRTDTNAAPAPAVPAPVEESDGSDSLREAVEESPGEPEPPIQEHGVPVEPEQDARRSQGDTDPFAVRDQLLLPVSNRALRNVKRQLAEEGNVVLEDLHQHPDEWAPRGEEIEDRVRADLVVLHAESFGAGHAAAERLTGRRLTRPQTPKAEVAAGFAADLVSDVEHALEEGRSADQGALQLQATVARVFRAWRTDESERRMRQVSLEAFNQGMASTLDVNGIEDVRWVVAGRGCAICRSLSTEAVSENIPPAHAGCECILVPR